MGKKKEKSSFDAYTEGKEEGRQDFRNQLIGCLINSIATGELELGGKLYDVINLISQLPVPPPVAWLVNTNLPDFVESFNKANKDERVSANYDDLIPRPATVYLVPMSSPFTKMDWSTVTEVIMGGKKFTLLLDGIE